MTLVVKFACLDISIYAASFSNSYLRERRVDLAAIVARLVAREIKRTCIYICVNVTVVYVGHRNKCLADRYTLVFIYLFVSVLSNYEVFLRRLFRTFAHQRTLCGVCTGSVVHLLTLQIFFPRTSLRQEYIQLSRSTQARWRCKP